MYVGSERWDYKAFRSEAIAGDAMRETYLVVQSL